ncbi:TfoX/Sxy family protein [Phytohabitans houttuyneae]|uniref:TfoX/Sxy family protein n=1 Tax=Phytohabitans houttuyneae TaxID=1076126 RepID=UPI0015674B10|nr:TfoX/Sxy family protein [Phytohabitans houttuyneae]
MAYDEDLADRVRELVGRETRLDEKRMFGGLAFMVGGNMAVVVRGKGGLMVRVDPAESEALQARPGVEAMVMRGREMAGWLVVEPARLARDADLKQWVDRGCAYARTLPTK